MAPVNRLGERTVGYANHHRPGYPVVDGQEQMGRREDREKRIAVEQINGWKATVRFLLIAFRQPHIDVVKVRRFL
jgi:hypothetical protein